MGNQKKINLKFVNGGLQKACQTNKSVERGFSGVSSANKNNGNNNGSNNTNQTTKKG